jgi:hypothetical protein
MSSIHDRLTEELDRVAPIEYMSDRLEIVEYYQQEYGPDWKSHIVDDLMAITGKSRNTVSREFQYDKRLGMDRYLGAKVTKATREKYEKLGKTLEDKGRKIPSKGFTVKVKGKFKVSPKKRRGDRGGERSDMTRERTIEVQFTGTDAWDFANDPSFHAFFEAYGVDGGVFGEQMDDGMQLDIY